MGGIMEMEYAGIHYYFHRTMNILFNGDKTNMAYIHEECGKVSHVLVPERALIYACLSSMDISAGHHSLYMIWQTGLVPVYLKDTSFHTKVDLYCNVE